jgi:O-antigen ligase
VATLLYLKELIVVLGLGIPLFAIAKPTALVFMSEGDFTRRRNIWVMLTCAAFLSPSFWLFVAIAAPLLYWGGKKDSNPIAFCLLLLNVIPSVSLPIPPVLVNEIFNLDIYRLLSLCVLIPAALRIRRSKGPKQNAGLAGMDWALLGVGVLQTLLFVPPDLHNHVILQNSVTNDLRSAFLFVVDIFAVYYVASRCAAERGKLLDALAAFCLACSLMSLTAMFESVKHWLLYTDLIRRWGGDLMLSEYYFRGPLLRAQGSSGQPLALGFLLVIGFGFWLYLKSHVNKASVRIGVTALLCAGLLVSFSRGPWLAAIVTYFAYAAFGPRGGVRLFKAAFISFAVIAILIVSPFGDRITSMIPFMGGKVGEFSLTYRERLVDRSWELIKARPIFGDQLALSKMQDLRQGQGIIDVVNGYIEITLFYGFAGLSLFLAFILLALWKAQRASRRLAKIDLDQSLLGANLAACIVALLVLLADGSLGTSPERLLYAVIGLAGAYATMAAAQMRGAAGQQHALGQIRRETPLGGAAT